MWTFPFVNYLWCIFQLWQPNPVTQHILELLLPAQKMKASFEYEPKQNANLQVNDLEK